MFIIGGVQALEGILPSDLMVLLQGLLSLLAMHFKLNPSQEYGKPKK